MVIGAGVRTGKGGGEAWNPRRKGAGSGSETRLCPELACRRRLESPKKRLGQEVWGGGDSLGGVLSRGEDFWAVKVKTIEKGDNSK